MSNGEEPYFRRHLGEVRLTWPDAPEEAALRAAQLGAILSLAGHLQTSEEAAQAVLPTGVGKTAVMCALPFLVPTTRVLCVVPTRLLRDQIAEEFGDLATLRAVGALPDDVERPKVKRVDHRLATDEAWSDLDEFDVAVGTPSVLSSGHQGVAEPPVGMFDLLLFDEAHHLPATTWTDIYEKHRQRSALLTATPFRRDRKRLPGSLVYHYSLRRAIADRVFAPVTFIPVEADPHDDQAIGDTAVGRLRSNEHVADGSLLLVRTDRIEHAKQLVTMYEQLGVAIGLITSQQSARTVRRTVNRLRSRDLEGVVSVGALVEGFDLPSLKIAAYHRPHKTLPPTLQFIGRIARVTGGEAPAELVAVRQAVTSETAQLYREDSAWEQLLPQLADAAVQRERATRHYLSEAQVSGPQELSPSALTPKRMVQVFETSKCHDISFDTNLTYLPHGRVVFQFVDQDESLIAAVTERRVRPAWIDSDSLDTLEYHLLLAVYDADRALLYVTAPSISAATQLRERIGAADATQVPPRLVARYLWASRVASYSSVGMSSTRAAARQAAYRMLAGSGVEAAVSLADVRGYGLGHVIGRREAGDGLAGMGVSVKKAKIWETATSESLLEFKEWCAELGDAITAQAPAEGSVPYLQLRLPVPLTEFPERPIAAFLDERLVRGDSFAVVDGGEPIDLGGVQLVAERASDSQMLLRLGFDAGDLWTGVLGVDGSVVVNGEDITTRTGFGEHQALAELLQDLPPRIYFADGSSSSGVVLFEPPQTVPSVSEEVFDVWDWAGTDIRNEFEENEHGLSILQRTLRFVDDNFDEPITIVDHGAYEIADVVAIEQHPETNRVHLFHCKASGAAAPGRRLADIYEVIGQAVRSARWSTPRALWRELERRVRSRPALQVIGGERDEVANLLAAWCVDPPDLDLNVWVVQPGVARAEVDNWAEGRTLIANAEDWCFDMPAQLRLAVSA